jgi:protein CpxP
MTTRLPSRAALLLAFALGATPAFAQNQPSNEPAPGTPPSTQAQPAPMTPQGKRLETRVERHIAELHRRLQITAQEEPQWSAFAQIMRENAARMDQAFQARAQQGPNMNAVEDLRTYAAVVQAHAEGMQRLVPAFEALYNSLTPQQQKTADQVFRDFEQRRTQRRHAG